MRKQKSHGQPRRDNSQNDHASDRGYPCPSTAIANDVPHTHPRTRASPEPTGHHQRRSPEMEGLFTRDAQAACDLSFSTSKLAPFFHRVSVMAAILRANVRRAMVGFIPFARAVW